MPECLKCGEELPEAFSYGDDVTCEKCGTVHETDCEYGWDGPEAWWVTNIKEESKP